MSDALKMQAAFEMLSALAKDWKAIECRDIASNALANDQNVQLMVDEARNDVYHDCGHDLELVLAECFGNKETI